MIVGIVAIRAGTSVVLSPERVGHAASLLNSGEVLLTGGVNESTNLGDALLYDETANTLTPTGSLVSARANHTSTLLLDGRVLITGGDLIDGSLLKSGEIYDPTTGVFTRVAHAMSIPRTKHTATLLQDGTVLIVGGKEADIFDPATELFTTVPSLPLNRSSHAAALLRDGTVLITGGYVGGLAPTRPAKSMTRRPGLLLCSPVPCLLSAPITA